MTSFLSGFLAMFFAILLFMTMPAYAITNSPSTSVYSKTAYFSNSTINKENVLQLQTTNNLEIESYENMGAPLNVDSDVRESCEISKLSDIEAAKLMELTKDGYQGEEISDGGQDLDEKKDLGDIQLIGNTNDGETGIKVDAPSQITSAERFSFLADKKIEGPWGIGIILDDTIRVGRCDGLAQEECRVFGDGLSYRTSGTGIKSDFSMAISSLREESTKSTFNLSEEEYERIQNNILDENEPTFGIAKWDKEEQIKNSILTQNYSATSATTCNNSACVISTYSAFDKYYNTWFSTEMVVSSFGPMLFHSAGRLFNKLSYGVGASKMETPLGKLVNQSRAKLEGLRSSVLDVPSSILGRRRVDDYQRILKEEGLASYVTDLTVKKKLFSSGAQGFTDDVLRQGSDWSKLPADKKDKLFEAVQHLRSYAQASKHQLDSANKKFLDQIAAGISEDQAHIEYSKSIMKQIIDWDDVTFLDFIDWVKDKDDLAFLQGIAVKNAAAPPGQGIVELSTGGSYNLKSAMQKFSKDGSFTGEWPIVGKDATNVVFETTGAGNALKTFKLAPSKVVQSNVPIDDLYKHVAKYGEGTLSVRLPTGDLMPLNSSSIQSIVSNPAVGGNIDILESAWTEIPGGMSAIEFAKRFESKRIAGRVNTANINLNDLYYAMREQGYSKRASFNLLDFQFARENKMLTDYFTLKPAAMAKGTFFPIAYWNLKRGAGNKNFSGYMLPDTWTTLTVSTGVDDVYKAAYTDFYANEGSDQGDLFARVINSNVFAWKTLIEAALEKGLPTIKEFTDPWTGQTGLGEGRIMRDEVKDLAFYSHNEECFGCVVPISYENNYFTVNGFNSPQRLQIFLVEAAEASVKKESGTTIVAYSHATDLKGITMGEEGDPINLVDARKQGTTCDQKLREFGLGWAGSGSGGVLAVSSSLVYAFGGIGPGLITTGIQQLILAPELQGCIDDKEGYYVHFYAPPDMRADSKKSQEIISNESISDAFSKMAQGMNETISSENQNVVSQSMNKIKEQFQTFSEEAKSADILQATVNVLPPNSGTLTGTELFYFWYKGSAMPSGYDTKSKTIIKDGNTEVEINKVTGIISIDGEKIIDKEDHTRMSIDSGDMRIPAQVTPVTLNKALAPNTSETVFEMNTNKELFVRNKEILDCIQSAIKSQSGIEYSGDELTQVFGELTGVRTKSYGNIFVRDGEIFLEGTGPRVKGGLASKFIVNGFWETKLQDSEKDYNAGKFVSITFKHGTIVLKEETNQIIIWLRQHKDSVLTNKDVSGLNAKPTTIQDPNNNCPAPAIDLDAMAYPNDQFGQAKVDNFNKSMQHLGPFTQFTTDTKTFIFYAVLDPKTGECKDYFKVIDKETGKVLVDEEIVGGFAQSDDGTISFKTADGKQHAIKFDAENGVPKVSYNGQSPETLRTAQGTNGSFWYDPNTGTWYPENGMQIPLGQSFKDNGGYFSTDDGKFSGKGENPMTFNIGTQGTGAFSLPSLPENKIGIILFITLFLAISFISTIKIKKKKIEK